MIPSCMLKLHEINHDIRSTLWCGPAALATVSGQPVSVVMQAFREVTGKKTIKGVGWTALSRAAARLGLKLEPLPLPFNHETHQWPTLAAYVRQNGTLFADCPVIVNVTGHYVTVWGKKFNDNWTVKPVSLKKAPRRRARVKAAWRVVKAEAPVAPVVVPPKPKDTARPAREEANRLARLHGVSIDKGCPSPDVIWVYPPPSLDREEADCHANDHACYDWDEALKRVKDYVRDLEALKSPASKAHSESVPLPA